VPDEFGEFSIERSSFLFNQQINEKIPNWVGSTVQINELEDET